jgi:CheY-like chemotaxis protein
MGPTILVAEDEEALAELLRLLLEDEGYRVLVAANGHEALDRLKEHRPRLVLSDMMMPGLDGRALAQAMAADPDFRGIPLVLMSAVHERGAREVPHAAFVSKPFDIDALLATVARLLKTEEAG